MYNDDPQRLWHFSRGERIAVVVLLIAIAATLLARRYLHRTPDIGLCDTTWLQEEVPAFDEQLVRPEKNSKKENIYRPKQQKLQPIEQEIPAE